jgi:peptidoglycan/xylan/chitin deacetylase (PgdA/CDA1 family)
VISVSQRLGYKVIQWSVDSLDWKRPGPQAVINNVLNGLSNGHGAKPGDIILFHASDSAPDTIKALPVVIDRLKGKNFSLVPVGQLLKSAKVTWPPESNLETENKTQNKEVQTAP